MSGKILTSKTCNFINLFADAFALSENLYIVTFMPEDDKICSLLISETETKVLITPQEAASDEMLSGLEMMTETNAKFVFNKEELLTLIAENTANLSTLTVVMEKHSSVGAEKVLVLIKELNNGKRALSNVLAHLVAMSTQKVKKLAECAVEMPALLQETFNNMI